MPFSEEELQRKWESLGISNDFIFGKVMQNAELCAALLRLILPGLDIGRVEFPEKQKTITEGVDLRGVRLDIFTQDDFKRLFDMEMEGRRRRYLSRRTRGYHIQIGVNAMERGQMKTYSDLPETYVIFICTFDPFDRGRHIYTFDNRCLEDPTLELGDGAHTVFLNSCGTLEDVSPELRAFLNFVMGRSSDDPFVKTLEARVREVKRDPNWRREFMVLFMRDQEKREEGLEEGLERGRVEGGLQMLCALVRKGLLSLGAAAVEAQMTEAEFSAQMQAYAV